MKHPLTLLMLVSVLSSLSLHGMSVASAVRKTVAAGVVSSVVAGGLYYQHTLNKNAESAEWVKAGSNPYSRPEQLNPYTYAVPALIATVGVGVFCGYKTPRMLVRRAQALLEEGDKLVFRKIRTFQDQKTFVDAMTKHYKLSKWPLVDAFEACVHIDSVSSRARTLLKEVVLVCPEYQANDVEFQTVAIATNPELLENKLRAALDALRADPEFYKQLSTKALFDDATATTAAINNGRAAALTYLLTKPHH